MTAPESRSHLRVDAAARHWAATWAASWPRKDRAAIATLYSRSASYRSLAFREPGRGLPGVEHYLDVVFAEEADIECAFGEPIVNGDRAAVQWWARWTEAGEPLTMAGVTILHFDKEGRVAEHRDYWNQTTGRAHPYRGW